MTEKDIARINELARKAKSVGLTPEEETERAALRAQYIEDMKASLRASLDNTFIMDEHGNKRPLKKSN